MRDGKAQQLAANGASRGAGVPCDGCPFLEPAKGKVRRLRKDADALLRLKAWGASRRELEVFVAKRRGEKVVCWAAELGISPRTAETHLRNLYRRLGVHTFIELEARLRAAEAETLE